MKQLLDVSTLLALGLKNHPFHLRATTWAPGKTLPAGPITEFGFVRIATISAYGATMLQARNTLASWLANDKPEFIAADLRALDGAIAPSSGKTTDWYLANLAAMHGMQWATPDTRLCRRQFLGHLEKSPQLKHLHLLTPIFISRTL